MYSTQKTVDYIKSIAKIKNISIGKMLSDCGLSKNALSSMQSRGSWLQANNLAKIADYLDCSVDYLLGRTDVVEVARSEEYITLPVAARSKNSPGKSAEPHKLTKQQWEEAQEALADLPDRDELPKFNLYED